jgi:hypothetical protein
MNPISDPFRAKRVESGVLECPFQGESVPMILRMMPCAVQRRTELPSALMRRSACPFLPMRMFEPCGIRLNRKPNPHLSFGFGTHLFLGALHARVLLRTLLLKLTQRVASNSVLSAAQRIEKTAGYERPLGFDTLSVRFTPTTR